MLLKAFLPNLAVNSAIVRRAAATSLTCVCQYSRRPSSFYSWFLSALFGKFVLIRLFSYEIDLVLANEV